MNITGGIYNRRSIKTVSTNNVRPTSSKVRESIFSIINHWDIINDVSVLDLFSGSGIMGFEFLSRGAKKVVFNEKNFKVYQLIKQNIELLKIESDKYQLIKNDALSTLDKIEEFKFDVIFLDPPYLTNLLEESLIKIKQNNLLNNSGLIIAEYPANKNINNLIEQLDYKIIKSKKYGDTIITFIQ